MIENTQNPFHVLTPEGLGSTEAVSLFVSEHTDIKQISATGHTIITGPRGVGKSMMFRYLMSDCQIKALNCGISDLPYWGVYMPIKNMPYAQKQTELLRLEQHNYAYAAISEHMMVLSIAQLMAEQLLGLINDAGLNNTDNTLQFFWEEFLYLLSENYADNAQTPHDLNSMLKMMILLFTRQLTHVNRFLQSVSFDTEAKGLTRNYDGILLDYFSFLQPFVKGMLRIGGMPKSVYLLIDDAHLLSETQTKILNMWVSTRTSSVISLKISTEYRYKTYSTINGSTIDTPHDYTYVDLGTIYTAGLGRTNYPKRVRAIVERRFSIHGISSTLEDFFPPDIVQEEAICQIGERLTQKFDEGDGRGNKRGDDAYRYARPDYIKSLAGKSKSSSTYSYSGFKQLVDLSSGTIRSFLQPAHEMYEAEKAKQSNTERSIHFIEPGIQNKIMRNWAEEYLFNEMDRYRNDTVLEDTENIVSGDWDKLSNLIIGLGGLYRLVLLDPDRSERRVFSFAFSDPENVSPELKKILKIGVNWGYFHLSTIGRKDSKFGLRTELYVMNRRLAPNWNLDPTGFAGYLFIKSELLEEGLWNPVGMLRRANKNEKNSDSQQLTLFDLEPGPDLPVSSALVSYPEGDGEDNEY
jgi:hypothetical protein